MTTNGPSDIRILLDDAISEYISDTGDAPHYRVHLLDLLESTLQADPQDTVTISRQAAQAILMPSEHRDQYGDALEELHQALTQEEPA